MENTVKRTWPFFFMAGISYTESDTTIRGLFAFPKAAYQKLAERRNDPDVPQCFILSTCNRTEIYGFATEKDKLIELLCSQTKGSPRLFKEYAVILSGAAAAKHLFEVASGLKSQILGDFDVVNQIRRATKYSREAGLLGAFTERLISYALKASKEIKNKTKLSSGTTSVAFAAVKFLQQIDDIQNKNILLYGIGKIGQSTCKNLKQYLHIENITLINRTAQKAKEFAEKQHLPYAPIEMLKEKLTSADIVLVATNAAFPTINKGDVVSRNKYILDLSIPRNVSEEVKEINEVTLIDVDELSKIPDNTLGARRKEIPLAEEIINDFLSDFIEWTENRKRARLLNLLKEEMMLIHQNTIKQFKKDETIEAETLEKFSAMVVKKLVKVMAHRIEEEEESEEWMLTMKQLLKKSAS